MAKAAITTHILDLHRGEPAAGVEVQLYKPNSQMYFTQGVTDENGRIIDWQDSFSLEAGVWKLSFLTDRWFKKHKRDAFFYQVNLEFHVDPKQSHYHVPLLLNEFGYSSYRGS